MPENNILLSVHDSMADDFVHSAFKLSELGYTLYATEQTQKTFEAKGVPVQLLHFPSEVGVEPNAMTYLREGKIDLTINVPTHESTRLEDNYAIRRTSVDFGIPLLTNAQLVKMFADAAHLRKKGELHALDAKSLFQIYEEEKVDDAWTEDKEFH